MELKSDKKLLKEAIGSGCKTVAELASYLKMRLRMQTVYRGLINK